jgi:hypothetical protein
MNRKVVCKNSAGQVHKATRKMGQVL